MSKRILMTIVLATLLLTACGGSVSSPPLVYLVSNGKLVDGFQSSYCWDGGIGGTLCVDTIEPYFDENTQLPASAPIQFQLDAPLPNEVTFSISEEVFGEPIVSEIMPVSKMMSWLPEVPPGDYILAVRASWKQGDVTYWFSVSLE